MAIDTSQQFANEPTVSIREPDERDDDSPDDDVQDVGTGGGGEPDAGKNGATKTSAQGRAGKDGSRKGRREAFKSSRQQIQESVMESVRGELGTFRTEFQRMLQGIQQPTRQEPRPAARQQPDQFEGRLGELDRAIQSELAAFRAHDHTKGQYDLTRHNQLSMDKNRLIARQELFSTLQQLGITPDMVANMKNGGGPGRGVAYDREAQNIIRFNTVKAQYPWIGDVKHATAVGRYKAYLHSAGRPDTLETDMEAAAHVQAEMNLGGPAPRGRSGAFTGVRGDDGRSNGRPREIQLPRAALNGLSKDEMAAVQSALFSEE